MIQTLAVLASGGLDSNVLIESFLRRGALVHPLYIRQGFRWERAELFWLKKFLTHAHHPRLAPLVILDAPVGDVLGPRHWAFSGRVPNAQSRDEAVSLPGRNLFLIAKAALWCGQNGVNAVAVGSLKGNPFPDATPTFYESLSGVVQAGLKQTFHVLSPFRKLDKQTVLSMAGEASLRFSFSCLAPRGVRACGDCNKCAELKKVLAHEPH